MNASAGNALVLVCLLVPACASLVCICQDLRPIQLSGQNYIGSLADKGHCWTRCKVIVQRQQQIPKTQSLQIVPLLDISSTFCAIRQDSDPSKIESWKIRKVGHLEQKETRHHSDGNTYPNPKCSISEVFQETLPL